MSKHSSEETLIAPADLGEQLAALRLRPTSALDAMRASMARHGQLSAIAGYRTPSGGLVLVDGFKRLEAARTLEFGKLRVLTLVLEPAHAKAAMVTLNAGARLSELEEAWLVRSLYRDDRLLQPAIGQLLGRDKSWVSRRLALAESLAESVQADVHLGIISASAARELARLPRGNQPAVAEVVLRRGLTAHQTARLVQKLLAAADSQEFARLLHEAQTGAPAPAPAKPPKRVHRTPAEEVVADAGAITRLAGRMQARLLGPPLEALGEEPAQLVRAALLELRPVVRALDDSIQRVTRS